MLFNRNQILCLLILGFTFLYLPLAKPQINLVLNPGFEAYSSCPTTISQLGNCNNWFPPTSGTSDYLNSCSTSNSVNPLHNEFQNLKPHKGNGMAGFYCYERSLLYREYVEGILSKPLTANHVYFVNFFVHVTMSVPGVNIGGFNSAVAEIGAYLSSDKIAVSGTASNLPDTPQIENPRSKMLNDTSQWMQISGYYKATGGEKYITIGNFFDNSHTHLSYSPASNANSYYFIDDVSVIDTLLKIYNTDTVYLCNGSPVTLFGSPKDSIGKWNNNSLGDSLIVSTPGKYWKISDSDGVKSIDTIIVISETNSVNLGGNIILCRNKPYTITLPANGSSYEWSDNSTNNSLTILKPGKYFVSNVDKHGCRASDTITVYKDSDVVFHLPKDTILCAGQNIKLDLSYIKENLVWQDSSTNKIYTVSKAGIYTVSVPTPCGPITATVSVTVINLKDSLNIPKKIHLCTGETYSINFPKNGSRYSWNGIDTSNKVTITNPGSYFLNIYESVCSVLDTIIVNYDSHVIFGLPKDTILCENKSILLDVSNVIEPVTWQDQSTDKKHMANKPGLYTVTTANACGTYSDSFNLKWRDCNCYVYIPNSFAPGIQPKNDSFKAILSCMPTGFLFNIYNRWGELIYSSTNVSNGWDGTFKNEPCMAGVYLYVIKAKFTNSPWEQYQGTVTLLR